MPCVSRLLDDAYLSVGSRRAELLFRLLVRRRVAQNCVLCESVVFSHSFLRVLVERRRPSAFWRCFTKQPCLNVNGHIYGKSYGAGASRELMSLVQILKK
ncbi:hypothetical protein MTO96_008653 [Rhipicephalus appendiculatus]|uniref:Uncharacterized protein n=1 Tax=Rhipicephalus appendiculatus TaxID=34631 RepID=A0A131YCT1_RHIAP